MSSPALARPRLGIEFEPRFCANHVVDLTAGCSFRCIYCPFADQGARLRGVTKPTPVEMAPLEELAAPPPTVFLSPASDPFAPQAASNAHAMLRYLLPRGTVVGILTKGIIPEHTLDLLAQYPRQVEGIGIGVTSLDDERNHVLEPGCPPARERLQNLDRLAARGLPGVLRADPLFPNLDDSMDAFTMLVDEAARRGAIALTATYVFAWGRYLRRLRREPLTAASAALLTERTPMEGGTAFSVPLARKLETYGFLADLTGRMGLWFGTCGCKDLRVRESGKVFASCRNGFLLGSSPEAFTRSGAPPGPAAGAPSALRGVPQR